jgi:hypothetical protein
MKRAAGRSHPPGDGVDDPPEAVELEIEQPRVPVGL